MKLAAQEHLLPGDTIADKWHSARRLGFDGIELRGAGDLGLEKRLPELRAAKAAGADFTSVCVAMPNFVGEADADARKDAVHNFKSQLSVIAELGGSGVITPASYGKSSSALARLATPLAPDEQRRVLLDALHEVGEHAAKVGALVLLEPLNRYETNIVHTIAQGAAICAEVGLASVRIMADLYHMNIEEDDPLGALRDNAAVLAHVHVCDSNRYEPGCGHIDFAAVIKTLREIGYAGPLALECRIRAPIETALMNAVKTLRDAGA